MSFDSISDSFEKVIEATKGVVLAMDTLTQKTTTGQYDQIFALSQQYINESFATLWKNRIATMPEIASLKVKNILGHIDAEIGPPTIIVDISPSDNMSFVLFTINCLSGTFILKDVDTG